MNLHDSSADNTNRWRGLRQIASFLTEDSKGKQRWFRSDLIPDDLCYRRFLLFSGPSLIRDIRAIRGS